MGTLWKSTPGECGRIANARIDGARFGKARQGHRVALQMLKIGGHALEKRARGTLNLINT
ncbi:MAG: hypothetical protein WBA61_13695 [Aequorivita sp.]